VAIVVAVVKECVDLSKIKESDKRVRSVKDDFSNLQSE
jgi:hypothetical protein